MAQITINGVTIDPLKQSNQLAAANLQSADASQSNYVLIQTRSPLTAAQRQELAGRGVEILEYIPDATYLCHYRPADLKSIRQLPYVAWANVYMQDFKIYPSLVPLPSAAAFPTNLLEMHAQGQGAELKVRDLTNVDIVLHDNVDPGSVRDKVGAIIGVDPSGLTVGRHKIRANVAAQDLYRLAQLDEVQHIEPVATYQLHNNVARGILGADSATASAFEGAGQVVCVCDTGFDKGSTTDVHPAFTGRVMKLIALGRGGQANDPNSHGTHVAGSVLGDGDSAVLGFRVRGTAPKAKLVLQSVLDSTGRLGGLPADLHNLFSAPYGDGIRIHTNSWGSTVGDGRYDQNADDLDDFIWTHRDFIVCFAAGNAGTDDDQNGVVDLKSLTPPGTAKNCITVGAIENNRPTFPLTYGRGWPANFPVVPLSTDLVADNPQGMVAFSSRGPVEQERIKPDILAPGTYILSARSRDTQKEGWGVSADNLYMYDGGTSMATPLVAGCVAVLREFLQKKQGLPHPSAALVKALLINSAEPITGQYPNPEIGPIPDPSQGFGKVDLAAAVDAAAIVLLQDESNSLDQGEVQSVSVNVAGPANRLIATLVWTDPPGPGLQNDLDLVVIVNGVERHGNMPAASPDFDRRNNVEQVVWDNPTAGPAAIEIRAFRITQFRQSYALVVSVR